MKKQNGVTLVTLAITIVVLIILATVSVHYGKTLITEAKLQDLRTNMLLIQAEAKKGLEEVKFRTANLDESNEEQLLAQINQIKADNLKGEKLQGSEAESSAQSTGVITEDISNYYYLNEETLKQMGFKDIEKEEYGYFVVYYNIEEITVEVINTNGYEGKYTLTEINTLSEE